MLKLKLKKFFRNNGGTVLICIYPHICSIVRDKGKQENGLKGNLESKRGELGLFKGESCRRKMLSVSQVDSKSIVNLTIPHLIQAAIKKKKKTHTSVKFLNCA